MGLVVISAMIGLVGCGGPAPASAPSNSETTAPSGSSTAGPARPTKFDICHVLTDEQLKAFGQPVPGTRGDAGGHPTCQFEGKPFTIGFQYAFDKDVPSFGNNDMMFSEFTRTNVNGRDAAHFLVTIPQNCSYVMDIGDKSSLWLWVLVQEGETNACAKAEEVARLIEPTLPKV